MRKNMVTILAVMAAAAPTLAAPITWGTAFEIAGESDIKVAGRDVVYAMAGGANGGTGGVAAGTIAAASSQVTIGGKTVTFEGLGVQYGTGSTYGALTYGNVVDHATGSGANVTFGVLNPIAGGATVPLASFDPARDGNARTVYNIPTGNSGLDTLLESQIWVDGRALNTSSAPSQLLISLNHLTAGTQYQVQLIAGADSRPSTTRQSANQFIVDDGLGHSVTGFNAYSDLNTDGVSHVTSVLGSFTADSTGSQAINVGVTFGRQAGISGVILTTVPEPASLAIFGLASVAVLRRRRFV